MKIVKMFQAYMRWHRDNRREWLAEGDKVYWMKPTSYAELPGAVAHDYLDGVVVGFTWEDDPKVLVQVTGVKGTPVVHSVSTSKVRKVR